LVLFDNILSTLLGIVLGIPLGSLLANIVIKGLGDNFDLTVNLTFYNIAVPP